MSAVHRVHSLSYVGAVGWATISEPPIPAGGVTFYGLAPGMVTYTAADVHTGGIFAVPVSPVYKSIAACLSSPNMPNVWLAGKGRLLRLDGLTGAVVQEVAADVDGRVIAAKHVGSQHRIYATADGGRLQRFTGVTLFEYGSVAPGNIIALVARDLLVYALTDRAELVTLTEDPVREVFREAHRLSLPALHGFRDLVDGGSVIVAVGYDRRGRGAVITIDLADPLTPSLAGADRTLAPSVILTADADGHVGTILPQDPDTLSAVPWSGRTDFLRVGAEGTLLVARPTLGEVWTVGLGLIPLVHNSVPLVHGGDDLVYST